MRKLQMLLVVVLLLAVPVNAMEFTAPSAPEEAQRYMPDETNNFAEGLWFVIRSAFQTIQPSLNEAFKMCASLITVSLMVSLLINISGVNHAGIRMAGTAFAAIAVIQPTNSMLQLGVDAVQSISEYGKLLLPVMTAALAAQGAVTKSGALYTASAFVNALLSSAVEQLLVPLTYLFLCVSIAGKFFGHALLDNIKNFLKWLMSWGLKTVLYVFTGYVSITGIVSGATDASLLKATKLTIAGAVPVVGNILSDASEAVLVSAGLMKNAAGIYGLITMIALGIGPFLQVGVQYVLLKITSGICHMFGIKEIADLIKNFSDTMGMVLAMIGTVCVIMLISTICFMKGTM